MRCASHRFNIPRGGTRKSTRGSVATLDRGARRAEPFQAVCIFPAIGNRAPEREAGQPALAHWKEWLPCIHNRAGRRGGGGSRLERAIVLELLSDDGERSRSIAELEAELGAAAGELTAALSDLSEVGVLDGSEGRVWASAATRRLEELELIGV